MAPASGVERQHGFCYGKLAYECFHIKVDIGLNGDD